MTATTDALEKVDPAAHDITDTTAQAIAQAWDALPHRYRDDDPTGLEQATNGAAALLMADTTLEEAAAAWSAARAAAADAEDYLTGAVVATIQEGATKASVCATLGIARTTLDRWLA